MQHSMSYILRLGIGFALIFSSQAFGKEYSVCRDIYIQKSSDGIKRVMMTCTSKDEVGKQWVPNRYQHYNFLYRVSNLGSDAKRSKCGDDLYEKISDLRHSFKQEWEVFGYCQEQKKIEEIGIEGVESDLAFYYVAMAPGTTFIDVKVVDNKLSKGTLTKRFSESFAMVSPVEYVSDASEGAQSDRSCDEINAIYVKYKSEFEAKKADNEKAQEECK